MKRGIHVFGFLLCQQQQDKLLLLQQQ